MIKKLPVECVTEMKIGALKSNDEPFVSIVPSVAGKLLKDGYEVYVESGAGDTSFYPDQQFIEAGAHILGRREILEIRYYNTRD